MTNNNQNYITLQAIKALRKQKLKAGIPFMINSDILAPHQCFLEYPNGIIKIVEADAKRLDFVILYKYSLKDSSRMRKKLNIT